MNADAAIEAAAQYWQAFRKGLAKLEVEPHPGASVLAFHWDQMVSARQRLLALGLDLADLDNPQVVPVPVAQHPKTDAEVLAWEAEMALRIDQLMLCWSVTGAGTHIVYSAVDRDALTDALLPYLDNSGAISRAELFELVSRSDFEILALACVIWLLEPTGPTERHVGDLDAACLRRMLYALKQFPIMKNAGAAKDAALPENDRTVAATILGGWSLANISLKGRAGGRLRDALGTKASNRVRYSRLLSELPGATQVAWENKRPEEALRPDGSGGKSLVRRVAAMIERDASEAVLHPGKVSADARDSEDLSGAEDQDLADFELRESVRQDLGQLRLWVERAHFSKREQAVYELDMRTDHDTLAIAEELKVTPETVRQYRKRYRDKVRKVAGL